MNAAIQMGRPTKCFQSTSDTGQQRSVKPAVSEPNTPSSAVPSNAALAADVAVFNWLQTNKVGGATVMNLAPGTSGQVPIFPGQTPSMPACQAWIQNLQNCNLLFALRSGLNFSSVGVRIDQPDDLSIARPAVQMPCQIGSVVGGDARTFRNQSVSPDSTVKEEEISTDPNRKYTLEQLQK